MKSIHKVSHIFQPTISIPHNNLPQSNLSSKSYELMINAGLINNTSTGFFAFLPLGLKALQKLINFIDEEMININAQKMLLPVLIPASLWTQTKRLSQAKPELFLVHDRHGKDYILSPVGHTFLLGTKYSESLKATFIDNNNKKQHLLMGCYGLGITRILAAAIEILSSNSEIRWPLKFVPYKICIIPPKVGSKEEGMSKLAYDLYFHLQESKTDVIIDDRTQMTIGRRFIDARRFGYPYVIIIGKHSLNAIPLLEVHDVYNASRVDLEFVDVLSYLKISPS